MALASNAYMALMKEDNLSIEEAMKDLKLKMRGEPDLVKKEHIALREDVNVTTDGFADRQIAMENKIVHSERSRATSRSELKITERLVNDLGSLLHRVNQLIETCSKIGFKVELRHTVVANRLEKVDAHMASTAGNAQLPSSRFRLQNPKKTKASRLSQ